MELSFGSTLLLLVPFLVYGGIFYWMVQTIAGKKSVIARRAEALDRIATALEKLQ